MNKTVYLIRHGQTSHNRDNNKLSGATDVQMTEVGRGQCRQLASYFKFNPVEQVFSSPMSRARESASLIFPDSFPIVTPGLVELNYGTYEGFDRSKMTGPDPIIDQWNTTPADMTFPGGDHVGSHGRRAYETLLSLVETADAGTLAVVSHRTTIRLLVAIVFGLSLNKFRQIPCSNCSLTILSYDTQLSLQSLNIPYNIIT